MPETVLIIGDRRRSADSLAPWLFLRRHGVPFSDVTIRLGQPGTRAQILEHSPSGKLPCLRLGAIRAWESATICEFAAEAFKLREAWPVEPEPRALARSIAQELHAGFADFLAGFPFDATRVPQTQKPSAGAAADIARIRAIWRDARSRFGNGGDWLFGGFGIVDALYAQVALRFQKYGIVLDGPEKDYVRTVLAMPELREWCGAALMEDDGQDASPPAPALAVPVAPPVVAAAKAPPAIARPPQAVVASPATPATPELASDLDDSELPPELIVATRQVVQRMVDPAWMESVSATKHPEPAAVGETAKN